MQKSLHFSFLKISIIVVAALLGFAAQAQDYDYIIPPGATWKYNAQPSAPSDEWRQPTFNDDDWKSGNAGFGYGDGDDTTLLSDMEGRYSKVQIRRSFTLNDVPDTLYLYINYDDAFTVYLNGKQVGGVGVNRKGRDIESHEATGFERFSLPTKALKVGENLLALEGFNNGVDSSDFSLHPALGARPDLWERLSADRVIADLEYLKDRLLTQSSYAGIPQELDPITTIENTIANVAGPVSLESMHRAVQRMIGLMVDGHARVSSVRSAQPKVYIPYSFVDTADGVVAIDSGKNKLADDQYYFVTAIDGIGIEDWISAAALYTPRAAQQLNRRRALRSLREVNYFRQDLGLQTSNSVDITFRNTNGQTTIKTIKLQDDRPSTAKIRKGKTRILDNNIGYLVIPEMDNDLIPNMHRQMSRFKDTDALIIDVRGNGGGRYGILRAMAGYFLPPEHGPVLTNVAKYRLAPSFTHDHLASRPTFRINDSAWTDAERDFIEESITEFTPEWTPPQDAFSDWHFMLINRQSDATERQFHYNKPVVVLSNSGSFSATDGFLAAFHLLPNSTQIGQPSGGGSGRGRSFSLPDTNIEVRVSSMASFRENGQLFDGNGVEVDIHIDPIATDFIGKTDVVLDAALTFLAEQRVKTNGL